MRYSLINVLAVFACIAFCSCEKKKEPNPLEGTWQLVSGTLIQGNDTTVTEYSGNLRMIKIINATHFSFLNHDLGKDSTKSFVAGGGRYELNGNQYTEHLEFCSDRAWEGHTFEFTVAVEHDMMIQSGVEKIEGIGVDRLNIEKYIRVAE